MSAYPVSPDRRQPALAPRPTGGRGSASPLLGFVPLLAPFMIAIAVLGAFVLYARLTSQASQPPHSRPGALVWGDAILGNRREVRAWLGLHGAGYHAWKRRHPAALALVTPSARATALRRAAPLVPPRAHVAKTRVAKLHRRHPRAKTVHVRAPKRVAATPSRGATPAASRAAHNWILIALLALGVLIGCAATLPRFVLVRIGVAPSADFRTVTAAMGVSILIGIAIVKALS